MKLQLLFASTILAAAASTAVRAANPDIQGAPNRYIVYPKKGFFDSEDIAKFFEQDDDITPVVSLRSIGGKAVNVKGSSVLDRLAGNPFISHIEKDVIRTPVSFSSEERSASLRGLINRDLAGYTYGVKMVGADVTPLNAGTTKQDLMVCIIDSGANKDHPGLAGVSISGEPGFSTDECGHGTHVTGTVAGKGGFGVAPGISVYEVQVFKGRSCGWSFSSDLIAATELCTKAAGGAKLIISMSLGGSESSAAEETGFKSLWDSGNVISVAAAGNGGSSAFSYPASYPTVMSVASIDEKKVRARSSQANAEVDVAAPGVAVESTYLDNKMAKLSGTSMATPHVSGSAAVVWSYGLKQGWTNKQVREALESTTEDLGAPGRDNEYGHGLINVCAAAKKAGFDPSNAVRCPGETGTPPQPTSTPTNEPTPAPTPAPTTALPTTSAPTPPTCRYPAWICCTFFDICD